jgi:tRNA(fMet)-specific endonuclease VapC
MTWYLLDTNAWVDYLTARHPSVARRLLETPWESVLLSSVVVGELRYGAEKSARKRESHARIDILAAQAQTVDFDLGAAQAFGSVRAALEKNGTPIGAYDMLIAAHALSLGATLVTDNLREFQRVAELSVESWREA